MKQNNIHRQIRAAREALGITRYQAAKRLGVSRTHYNRWESGLVLPNIVSLRQIAVALHTTQAALLGEGIGR